MELAEQETIVLINNEDRKAGFFKISTSLANVALGVKRRFKDDIIKTNCPTHDGKEVYWDFWIKASALTESPFIARRRVSNLSEEQKRALAARLATIKSARTAGRKTDGESDPRPG